MGSRAQGPEFNWMENCGGKKSETFIFLQPSFVPTIC